MRRIGDLLKVARRLGAGGGALKRRCDGVMTLAPGSYLKSAGSHWGAVGRFNLNLPKHGVES